MAEQSIESINAITFVTNDMAQSVAFYEAMGFVRVYGGPDAPFSSLRGGASFVNLTTQGAPYEGQFWGRVIFHVHDVDDMCQRALDGGYAPDTSPSDASWGERYFHIRDPDGHELSFARRL
jgi:catechol 2,3-dioxygenase-like lactoylglutathione lyase family enzyme